MKKTVLFLILFLTFTFVQSQEILNINPDNAIQGQNIEFTISGQNAHFLQASNTTVWFSQGSSTIIYPIDINSFNDNTIYGNISFDLYDSFGLYNVNINNSVDGDITLENGFMLNAYSTDTLLISVSPTQAPQNTDIWFTISGYNTNFSQGSNTVWFTQGSNTVYSDNTFADGDRYLLSNFIFTESDPNGFYDLYVQNSTDGTLLLENEFTLLPPIQYPEIISVTPNEADKGNIIDLTISGNMTHFNQATNTIWFSQGSNIVIYPKSTDVINDSEISAQFAFFNTYESGYYNVHVSNYIDSYLYLEDGFLLYDNPAPPQLISNTPDKAPRNENITLSISGQNTNFTQATNLVWLNQDIRKIYATNYTVSSDILLEANFAFETTDSVGVYNLSIRNEFDGDLHLDNSFSLSYGTFISNNELIKIIVFPNPSNGNFRIDNIPEDNCKVDIIKLDGEIIKSYTKNSNTFIDIRLDNLEGYYFVRISNDDSQISRKVLIINEN